MSEQNVPHQWKCEPCDTNAGNCNYFGNSELMRGEATSSSFAISGQPNLPGEVYTQQHQSQPHNELQKLSNFSKISALTKISSFDGVAQMPEDEKLRKVQQIVEAGVGDHAKQQILQILDKISLLKPPERLLLYLRMPGGTPETDPLRQPQNPLGTRSEINHTINWVRSHLEHDPKVSIPKQDVYNDYLAYCERVDIKPLSTADFGKVMKQVFPEIRPRRLGTRGHSRYCYAAMRKATKLDPPHLPTLGANAIATDFNGIMDEDSWKIIKLWAEGLLNASFDTLKDLASHITRHHLNTPASNSSRLLLQKKLLQREAKEKRKFVDASPLKKRRKKKRRSSSSSESAPQPSSIMLPDGHLTNVKEEILDTSQQMQAHQVQQPVSMLQAGQQMLPMNLVTEHDASNPHKIQGTNLCCDNNLVAGCTAKSTVAHNLSPVYHSLIKETSNITSVSQNLQPSVKEETTPDEYNANVLCKKVRQAQQSKGLWNPLHNMGACGESQPLLPSSEHRSGIVNYSRITDNVMGPPSQVDICQNVSTNSTAKQSTSNISSDKSASPPHLRARKLRYLHAKLVNAQEEQTGADNNGEKDVLPENLGIPRERVISICNMDKHELDDYLNGGDNSQDQEAELLQYFQPEDSEEKRGENEIVGAISETNSNAFPVVDNYQSLDSNQEEKKPTVQKDQDEITQLRYYLHQNLQSGKESPVSSKGCLGQSTLYSGNYSANSASASLTMMSQRHLMDESNKLQCCNTGSGNIHPSNDTNSALRGPKRKINLNARSCVPSSPNTRRKNFSFVPISPNINTPNSSVDYSPFVSPRSTPVVRKPPLYKQQSLPLADSNLADPMIGATTVPFSKGVSLSTVSASAPPSPSLVQQRFIFVPSTSSTIVSQTNGTDQQFNHFQSVAVQCRGQNLIEGNLEGVAESRSQSVPLHCRSPSFSQSSNFPGFSSACNSVAQTPVPTEFADFTDPSTILDIFSDTSQHNPVKLEINEIGPSILDVDITSNESGMGMNELLVHEFDSKANTASRSVPSTPLPMLNYKAKGNNSGILDCNKVNKAYDISKSVPTTPIAMNVAPFRYSPEFNRDFLINGNTVDTAGIPYYNHQTQSNSTNESSDKITEASTSLTARIDEISNFGDVSESIIGGDILESL